MPKVKMPKPENGLKCHEISITMAPAKKTTVPGTLKKYR